MNPFKRLLFTLLALMIVLGVSLVQGCAYRTETISHAPRAFLSFTGVAEGEVWVNGRLALELSKMKKNSRLAVDPGVIAIEVRRAGEVILKRTILASNGQVTEIRIP